MALYYHKFPISETDRPKDKRIHFCGVWLFNCYW